METVKRLCCLIFIFALAVYINGCSSSSESKPKKQIVSFADVWFPDQGPVDYDHDGYFSYLPLHFDLDVSNSSVDLFVEIYVRVTDPLDTATYYGYIQTESFTISGSTQDDAKYIAIGDPDPELPEGRYDFLILVYKESDPNNPILELASYNDDNFGDVLTNVPLEESATDAALTIYEAYWDGVVDNDQDGYASTADLVVDVDVTRGVSPNVYLVVYQKYYSSSTYTLLAVTETFSISGASSGDARALTIENFPHGLYDFKIDVYYDVGYNAEDTDDALSNPDLNDVQLEPAAEDVPPLGTWIWYYDSVLEDLLTTSLPAYYAVRFDKPSGTVTCSVKEIYLYVLDRDTTISYANFKIWDNSINNFPNAYLYDGTTDVYIAYDANNYYQVDVDVSANDVFYAGFYRIYANGFSLGGDASSPDARSYYRDSSTRNWRLNILDDYCISVYVEYTTGKNKNSLVTRGQWINESARTTSGSGLQQHGSTTESVNRENDAVSRPQGNAAQKMPVKAVKNTRNGDKKIRAKFGPATDSGSKLKLEKKDVKSKCTTADLEKTLGDRKKIKPLRLNIN